MRLPPTSHKPEGRHLKGRSVRHSEVPEKSLCTAKGRQVLIRFAFKFFSKI